MHRILSRAVFSIALLVSLWLFYIQGMQPLIPASLLGWHAHNGRYLIFLRPRDAITLDPARAADPPSAQVLASIFEGLVRLKPEDGGVEPCLAKSWTVSTDGLQWTFHLRPGVVFQDGTPFNARAVKFSVERAMSAGENESPYASFVYGVVQSVSAPDNLTVRFTLKYPYAPFLHNLAMPFAAPIVSPEAVKKYGPAFESHPVGTGPFMFQNWTPGKEIILTTNPAYWGPKPALPGVIFRVEPDAARRCALLRKGLADAALEVPPEETASLSASGCQIIRTAGLDVSYLGFYTDKRPFNDPRVRAAACRAINVTALLESLFAGRAIPAGGPLPPGILGYDSAIKQYPFDPERAKQELSAAGYPGGLTITLITYTNTRPYNPAGGEKLAAALADQLNAAGIHCRIKAYPWTEYKQALYKEEGNAFIYGWTGDNRDPDNFLYALLASPQIACGLNASRYHNREVDNLLLTAQRTDEPQLRAKIYRAAQQIIVHDAPLYFLNHSLLISATGPEVRNLSILPGGIPVFRTASGP